ncbi:DUF4363 family protein [Calorimonas adulescens]|uniref:DUF4363 family protein n=1 Tax=Calorimonas adulescens TaxID=2606906 RepID=A0A5D8Q930_9THEO|nr:DUF4363 family protein [Calorimonas adulescens]
MRTGKGGHKVKTAIVITVILLAFIFVLDLGSYYYLKDTAMSISQSIEALPEKIENEKWDTATDDLNKASNRWSSVKGIWAVLINHDEIDKIDMSLVRLRSFVQYNDTEEAMAEYNTLKMLVKHIPENQRFSLVNIF